MPDETNPMPGGSEGEPNPFAFEDAENLLCTECGGSVPRELAKSKAKIKELHRLGLWGVFFTGIASGVKEQVTVERSVLCPLCFQKAERLTKHQQRRERLLACLL